MHLNSGVINVQTFKRERNARFTKNIKEDSNYYLEFKQWVKVMCAAIASVPI